MSSILEVTLNEINCAYAAKNIAQYLQVTVPEAPPEWKKINRAWAISDAIFGTIEGLHSAYLFMVNREVYHDKKRYIQQEEARDSRLRVAIEENNAKMDGRLKKQGVVTNQERDAYTVAHFTGLAMGRFVNHAIECPDLEIVGAKHPRTEEIKITPRLFDDYLIKSMRDGIVCLEEGYWISIRGVLKPRIINPEFMNKAFDWLKAEISLKTENNHKCRLLETVVVMQEADGRFNLKRHYIPINE